MSSTFSKMAQKVTDKIDQMGEKNKQTEHSSSTNYGHGHTQGHDGYSTTTGPGGIGSSDTYSSNTNNPAYNNSHATNAGPHNSSMMNKVDPRIDSDRDGRNDPTSRVGGYGTTQHVHDGHNTASGPGGYSSTNTAYGNNSYGGSHTDAHTTGMNTGTHNAGMHTGSLNTTSGFGNSGNTSYDNPQSMNAGPHNSNMANKFDPRIDSDRDGRNGLTSHTGGYGHTQTGYGSNVGGHAGFGPHDTSSGYGSSNTNTSSYDNSKSTSIGPHKSSLLNKLDPRVDSDMKGRNNPASHTGGYGQTQGEYGSGVGRTGTTPAHHATTGHGHMSTTAGSYDNQQSTTTGPHKSSLLNKLDPRVDSDRDGRNNPTSHTGGYGQTQSGHDLNTGIGHSSNSGAGYSTTTTTTHHPTVVTQTTHGGHHTGNHGGSQGYTNGTTGNNQAQSTNTGPHNSSMLNKLDPRVDSDRDGRDDSSSRVGGYGNTQSGAPKYY